MRVFLLLVTIVCFFLALVYARHWNFLWINPSWQAARDAQTWTCVAGMTFAASFLPWGTRFAYWFGRKGHTR